MSTLIRLKKILVESSPTQSLRDILLNKKWARLGDTYVNFIYSLAYSAKFRELSGLRVRSDILAEALRRTGLRDILPGRMNRYELGNAAEALIIYGWASGSISEEECINILKKQVEDPVEAFTSLLTEISKRLGAQVNVK